MKPKNQFHTRIAGSEFECPNELEMTVMKLSRAEQQKRISCRVLDAVARVAIAALFSLNGSAGAATVNWLDPLAYQKPQAVDVTEPNEANASKYYVDLSNGSDSNACSSGSPCRSFRGLAGKGYTALQGGPGYVYVRGSGPFYLWGNDKFYGSPGKEIVIKPWPGFTATFTNGGTNASLMGNPVHDIIFDGGPDLGLKFVQDRTGSGNYYVLEINASNTTIYRVQAYSTVSGGGVRLFAACTQQLPAGCQNIQFINNEFHTCDTAGGNQCSSIYFGACGAADTCGYRNAAIKNNIIRNMGGEGIEINPRVTSDGLVISGNAIHNVGKMTCSGDWECRPGITLASMNQSTGNTGVTVKDNLIWDTGSGCIWDRGNVKAQIYYNTCYDYGKGTGANSTPQAVTGYQNGGDAIIRNNIFYAPNGSSPFDNSPFTASNNLCVSGKSCGSAMRTWSANSVLSTDQNSSGFLRIGASSEALNNGYFVSSVSSYGGSLRPPYDIGAFVSTTSGNLPPPPSNLRVQ